MDDSLAIPEDDPRLLGVRKILAVMDALRAEGGCPWDREQTHESLRSYLIEEAYELLEAIDGGETAAVREELGDVLFQVVFHARLAQERGDYHLGDVADGIATKLHGRHPHVFGGEAIEDPAEVQRRWDERKQKEQGRASILDGVPQGLPALLRAQRLQEKAARVGFDWPDQQGPLDKLGEELEELKAEVTARRPERIAAELGDLLFSAVNLARHLGVDAESSLREAGSRFDARFRQVESRADDLRSLTLAELEELWQAVKADEV